MSFMSVPGVLPAKTVVKMLLSRGRYKTGELKEIKGERNVLGRKTVVASSGRGQEKGDCSKPKRTWS